VLAAAAVLTTALPGLVLAALMLLTGLSLSALLLLARLVLAALLRVALLLLPARILLLIRHWNVLHGLSCPPCARGYPRIRGVVPNAIAAAFDKALINHGKITFNRRGKAVMRGDLFRLARRRAAAACRAASDC
jgi:hypothetical protein